MRIIRGTIGTNNLTGDDEDDVIYGGGAVTIPLDGSDTLLGGGGNDALYGNGGDDRVLGESGADLIYGGIGDDVLYGGAQETDPTDSADVIYGQDGRDLLYGNGGNDTLLGGDWTDTIYGGEGDDAINGGNAYASVGDGADWIAAGPGRDVINGDEGDDTIFGGSAVTDADDDEDTIDGGSGNDVIYGNGGDDSIVGGDGNDTIYSGLGIDTLEGGNGDDTFTLGFSDRVTGGAGVDSFILDASTLSNSTSFSELLQITDLEAGESLQITGVSSSQTASISEDANGNAIIEIDGQAFAQLTGIASSAIEDQTLTNLFNPTETIGNPTFGIGASSGPGNSAPVLGDLDPNNYAENTVNTTPQIIDIDVTFTDSSSNFNNGFVELTYSSGGGAEDSLSVRNQGAGAGQIGFDGTNVSYEGTTIGTVFGAKDGSNGNDLLIIFNADSNQQNVELLLENLTYANSSDNPTASREINVLLNDGSLDSEPLTAVLTVTAENDTPTLDNALIDQAGNVTSAFSYTFAANSFSEVDSGDTLTYTVTSGLPGWATFTAGTRTISGTPAAGQAATSSVTIRATDSSGAFVEDTFDITIGTTITGTVNADTLTGSAQDETFLALTGVDNIDAQGGDDTITIADWEAVALPNAISAGNLQLWLDASDESTITESGGAVSEWRDKSGQGNDASDATSGTNDDRPTSGNESTNGRNTFSFDGDDFLENTSFALGTVGSFFAIASVGAGGVVKRIINNEDNFHLGVRDNALASFYGNGTSWGTSANHGADSTLTQDQAYILTSILDSTNDNPFVNGLNVGSRADTMAAFSNGYTIGKKQDATSQYWDNTISEILIFDTSLSDADRQSIERYFSNKYGIALDASVPNSNDVIDGGTGTDTLTISSGQFLLNPGTLSNFNSIETFNLSGNDAAHEITLTDDYYDTNNGVESDLVTVNLSGNSTGSEVNGATLTGTHAISVQGSDGNDTVHGGAASTDHLDYSARTTAVTVNQPTGNFSNLDSITGGNGGDTLTGGNGDQTLTGGEGDDFLYGDVDVESFDVSNYVSGNQLWLDAADASTITESGGVVSQWNDKSGEDNHATDVTGGSSTDRPKYNNATLNGRSALDFDGGDFLQNTSFAVSSENLAVFAIFQIDISIENRRFFDLGDAAGTTHSFYISADFQFGAGFSAGYRYPENNPIGFTTVHNNPTLISYNKLGANSQTAWLEGSNSQTNTGNVTTFTSQAYTIGARNNSDFFWEGKGYELIAFNNVLSVSSRQQIETYLAEKWGIAYAGTVNDEDSLNGGDGDDYLSGGVGDDTLTGGADNDTLEGGLGDDSLSGSSGNDAFTFKNNSGQDTIADFENPGAIVTDVIQILSDINDSGITDWTTLQPNISQNGADTEINLDPANPGTHMITLTGITPANLDASDFVFI